MDWVTASQLAGEIVDIVGIKNIDARQQEEIASLIYNRHGWIFNSHSQKWQRGVLAQSKPSLMEGGK